MEPIIAIFGVILGLCIGSFLNVCIYRLPIRQSIINPPSHCPQCKTAIKYYDNIPVLSYLLLIGKCRQCSAKIPLQYPLVELLTALGFLLMLYVNKFALDAMLARNIIFFCVGLVIFFIDLRHYIIPDVLSIPLFVVGMAFAFITKTHGWLSASIGSATGFILFYLIAFIYYKRKQQMGLGGGDIKYIAAIGAFTGFNGIIFTLFFSSFIALLYYIFISIIKWRPAGSSDLPEPIRQQAVPYAPFLTITAMIYLLWGKELLGLYVELFYRW